MNNTINFTHENSKEKQIFYKIPDNGVYKYEVEFISGNQFILIEVKEKPWPEPPLRTLIMTFENEFSAKNALAKLASEIENHSTKETIEEFKKTSNKNKYLIFSICLNVISLLFLISQLS